MKGYSFDAEKHHHLYDGKRMYGCTSVLQHWGDKSGLINWAANCAVDYLTEYLNADECNLSKETRLRILEEARTAHTKKRDKAGDNGTKVHAELEVMMNNWIEGELVLPSDYSDVVTKVRDWMLTNGITPLKSEMPVYSLEHFYAGIADGVIEKDGKKYILDFKTSGYVYTTAFFQMGAYAHAIKEMKPGAEIAGTVVVHIPRGKSFNPDKNTYWFYDIEVLEQGFLNILSTYKTDQALQKLVEFKYSNKTSIKI